MVRVKEDKDKVGKNLFSAHADFDCDRNVFLKLSQIAPDSSEWRTQDEILKRERNPVTDKLMAERGKEYEQEAYKEVLDIGERLERRQKVKLVFASVSKQGEVYRTAVRPGLLQGYLKNTNGLEFVLLEHEFDIPASFTRRFAGLDVAPSRPDLMFIRPLADLGTQVTYYAADGSLVSSSSDQLEATFGLSVVDIKSIPGDRVGHKYYSEVTYYLQTLNHYIRAVGLSDLVVLGQGNGILPNIENIKLHDFEEIRELMIPIHIDQVGVLYDRTMELVDELVATKPLDRKQVEQHFGAHCDKCQYLDDCLRRSGYDSSDSSWAEEVDVSLLPNTNSSIISQLKSDDITTIKELQESIPRLRRVSMPQPINAILPLISHKTSAILSDEIQHANPSQIFATSIPKNSRTKVTFTIETDSTTDLAFGFGILLESAMGIRSKAKHKELFFKWWNAWFDYFESNEEYNKLAVRDLFTQFKSIGFLDVSISDLIKFAKFMHEFQTTKIGDRSSLRFTRPGDELRSGRKSRRTVVELAYVDINLNITREAERQFLKSIIQRVSKIIQITLILEKNIKAGKSFANSAFYYWSSEIVSKIEELIENHLDYIVTTLDLYNDLFFISQWISPSNQVTDPNQLKRIYDLSKFVDSTMGMPLPINYTWHKVASTILKGFGFNKNYWSDLFNNMDRSQWHAFVLQRDVDQTAANAKYLQIQSQIYSKIRTLGFLVDHFQFGDMTRSLISDNPINIPKEVRTRATDTLPAGFHPLARNWYLFATLTESVDELEKVELRSTYPEAAIGKLEAARVTNLQRQQLPVGDKTDFYYTFELRGLSRNVKFSEGSRLLLIPIQIRDSILSFKAREWLVTLQTMQWDNKDEYYLVSTSSQRKDIFELVEKIELDPKACTWFLYPDSVGYWASKLFSNRSRDRSLLVRNNLGNSILGHRLSVMWDMGPMKELPPLKALKFNAAEVYMYAPDIMSKITYPRPAALSCQTEFPPDPSQEEAIFFALESPLRLILGPPGTGKSQTIVALIDEFLQRRKQQGQTNNRILVTSFAYTASNVLLEKICRATDANGSPNLAAQTQKVYITSQSRDLPQLSDSGPTFKLNHVYKDGARWWFDRTKITPKADTKLDDLVSGNTIFFGNAHQIHKLDDAKDEDRILSRERLEFDLIIVDEASQLPTDHMLSIYQHVRSADIHMEFDFPYKGGTINPVEMEQMKIKNTEDIRTHVVLVGDDSQLPPVQQIKPPENLKVQLGSVFDYYKNGFELATQQLKYNYRSHRQIVEFTASLDIYEELEPSPNSVNRDRLLPGDISQLASRWTREVLEPKRVVSAIIHGSEYDTSVSMIEAEIVTELVLDYMTMVNPQTVEDQLKFWYEGIGIVAPHNAHSRTIINMINQRLSGSPTNRLKPDELMTALKDTIFSVEKFQGSERDLIIGSIGVSAKDQLRSEEEFIYNLNRLNVLLTRAKSKMVLVCSENFLEHIPDDQDRFFEISILKKYVNQYTQSSADLNLELPSGGEEVWFFWR